jgi:hypothetical protein
VSLVSEIGCRNVRSPTSWDSAVKRQFGLRGWNRSRPSNGRDQVARHQESGAFRHDSRQRLWNDLSSTHRRTFGKTLLLREGTRGKMTCRLFFLRVRPAHRDEDRHDPRDPEWLIAEWPKGEDEPTNFWLSTMPSVNFPRGPSVDYL